MNENSALFFLGFEAKEALSYDMIERIKRSGVLVCSTPCGRASTKTIEYFLSENSINYALSLGFCGGVQECPDIADVFLPYECDYHNNIAYPYGKFSEKISKYVKRGKPAKIETVDSLGIETPYFLERMRAKKVGAVEMELFHFLAKCNKSKVESAAALVVSDILNGGIKSVIHIPDKAAIKISELAESYLDIRRII